MTGNELQALVRDITRKLEESAKAQSQAEADADEVEVIARELQCSERAALDAVMCTWRHPWWDMAVRGTLVAEGVAVAAVAAIAGVTRSSPTGWAMRDAGGMLAFFASVWPFVVLWVWIVASDQNGDARSRRRWAVENVLNERSHQRSMGRRGVPRGGR